MIVDKTLKELLPIADHCIILERGKTVFSGNPEQLNEQVRSRYLGV
ncbi:MAG: ABC transporter related protein [Osedax symbiont Rs2]|nr:MAG: ABC transporter related protein [Osedax symbiont Rs2]